MRKRILYATAAIALALAPTTAMADGVFYGSYGHSHSHVNVGSAVALGVGLAIAGAIVGQATSGYYVGGPYGYYDNGYSYNYNYGPGNYSYGPGYVPGPGHVYRPGQSYSGAHYGSHSGFFDTSVR